MRKILLIQLMWIFNHYAGTVLENAFGFLMRTNLTEALSVYASATAKEKANIDNNQDVKDYFEGNIKKTVAEAAKEFIDFKQKMKKAAKDSDKLKEIFLGLFDQDKPGNKVVTGLKVQKELTQKLQ